MKKLGIYIHIPFCKQKCYYCDFISFTKTQETQNRYVKSLIKEIKKFKEENSKFEISTIYIGGGTPSFIDAKHIKEILKEFDTKNVSEITIEVNPGTVSKEKLEIYKESGINRLSIGLQSTSNKILKEIGRIHNFQDFLNTYKLAKEVGFNNINVDLMIGLPHQKIEDIKNSLEAIIKLDIQHISVYSLIVEENTRISEMIENGTAKLPDEDTERNMYWFVKNYLELHGYNHYEISNFAKKGYESKHNVDCWKQREYIGLGVAAHSYVGNRRFSNTENLEEYIKNCENNNFNKIVQEEQDNFMKEQEYMLLGLRMIEGVSIKEFKNKFVENPIIIFRNELNKLVSEKLLEVTDDKIKLTNKGIDLANIVWEEFV